MVNLLKYLRPKYLRYVCNHEKFVRSSFVAKVPQRLFITKSAPNKFRYKFLLYASTLGATVGALYSYFTFPVSSPVILNSVSESSVTVLSSLPDVRISKKVKYAEYHPELKVTLFQYPTCPFCCKVRAFLDYYGISYDIVEVNPIFKKEVKWSEYKKVPIVIVKHSNKYTQLNDSSMIISVLSTYLNEKNMRIFDIARNYPTISYVDDDGKVKKEVLNRYFLMYQDGAQETSEKSTSMSNEERKWRKWADEVLVHTLSPNVYRTTDEALQAFKWFSEVGEWRDNFTTFERFLMVNLGAFSMWLISKRLKKRHRLKEDVRLSLYEETNTWINEVKRKGKFHGGFRPDLADLAVYGVLSSIEGCEAFRDLLSNTMLQEWFVGVREQVQSQNGGKLNYI